MWLEVSKEFRQLVRHRTLTGKNTAENFHDAWLVVYVKDGKTCETSDKHLNWLDAVREARETCNA